MNHELERYGKVLATEKLPIPYILHTNLHCNVKKLPKANSVQSKAYNKTCLQRCILHLITINDLRAVHIFHFKEDHTEWRMYEPYHSPLTVHEVRGMMVYAIKQFRNPTFLLSPTNIRSNSFIWSTKPIREYLDSLQQEDKIFIVLTFKDWSYAVGNYYDETTLCRALLEYQPRKAESVMRNVDKNKRVLIPKTGSMNQPKSVHLPVFNLYESGKIML